eukprot:COSAG06_NODE_774_length_12424_cov_35.268014_3_plen_192_part_00
MPREQRALSDSPPPGAVVAAHWTLTSTIAGHTRCTVWGRFGGLRLWWAIFPCESASVGAGDVVGATEPEPELEDAQEVAAVAQHQRLAAMEAQESGAGSSPAPVQCVVRLIVGFPGYQGGQGFGATFRSVAKLRRQTVRQHWLWPRGRPSLLTCSCAHSAGGWSSVPGLTPRLSTPRESNLRGGVVECCQR